jgi:hypothetical protein
MRAGMPRLGAALYGLLDVPLVDDIPHRQDQEKNGVPTTPPP